MSEKHQTPADRLMEQAQVFASAWSLVDGPFDDGHALEKAEDEKENLRDMIEELLEAQSEQVEGIVESIQQLIDWHQGRVEKLKTLEENAKEGVVLDYSDGQITLTSDMAKGIRIALVIALSFIGKLPITLGRSA